MLVARRRALSRGEGGGAGGREGGSKEGKVDKGGGGGSNGLVENTRSNELEVHLVMTRKGGRGEGGMEGKFVSARGKEAKLGVDVTVVPQQQGGIVWNRPLVGEEDGVTGPPLGCALVAE